MDRNNKRERPVLSEWEIDPITGRRFRKFGNTVEWEPDYVFSHGKTEEPRQQPKSTMKLCPLSKNFTRCREDCVCYVGKCGMESHEMGFGSYCPMIGRDCPGDLCSWWIVDHCILYKGE